MISGDCAGERELECEEEKVRIQAGAEDPLVIPFIWVPQGSEPPADWLARHPDAVRIPAVMVPRGTNQRRLPGHSEVTETVSYRVQPGAETAKPMTSAEEIRNARVRAFLHLLRWLETGSIPEEQAYRQRVGHPKDPLTDEQMEHYAPKREPATIRRYSRANHRWETSRKELTAAEAYQITGPTWRDYSKKLGFSGFSPADQTAIALALISDADALQSIEAGNLTLSFEKLNHRWTSLPGGAESHHSAAEVEARFLEFLNEELQAK